jgi:hypothetical protein
MPRGLDGAANVVRDDADEHGERTETCGVDKRHHQGGRPRRLACEVGAGNIAQNDGSFGGSVAPSNVRDCSAVGGGAGGDHRGADEHDAEHFSERRQGEQREEAVVGDVCGAAGGTRWVRQRDDASEWLMVLFLVLVRARRSVEGGWGGDDGCSRGGAADPGGCGDAGAGGGGEQGGGADGDGDSEGAQGGADGRALLLVVGVVVASPAVRLLVLVFLFLFLFFWLVWVRGVAAASA